MTVFVFATFPVYSAINDAIIGSRKELVARFKGKRGARRFIQGAYKRRSHDDECVYTAECEGRFVDFYRCRAPMRTWQNAADEFIPF